MTSNFKFKFNFKLTTWAAWGSPTYRHRNSSALGSADFTGLTSTSDPEKYTHADFIVTAISTAVDKTIPKSKRVRSESNPISDETIALIKEKRRLRRQYSQNKDQL